MSWSWTEWSCGGICLGSGFGVLLLNHSSMMVSSSPLSHGVWGEVVFCFSRCLFHHCWVLIECSLLMKFQRFSAVGLSRVKNPVLILYLYGVLGDHCCFAVE